MVLCVAMGGGGYSLLCVQNDKKEKGLTARTVIHVSN
jgi:hypothetical protein